MVLITLHPIEELRSVFLCSISVILLFFLLQYHWTKRKFYTLSRNLPGPFSLPVIGNAHKFFCDDKDIFNRFLKQVNLYASPMRLWIGPKLFVVFKEADDIQKLLTSSAFSNKEDALYRFLKEFEGEGLIAGSGSKWKQDRRLLTPIFSSKNISCYYPILLKQSQVLVEKLKPMIKAKKFDIEKYVQRCITEIVLEMFSGMTYNAQNGKADHFIEAFDEAYILVQTRITKVWLHSDFIFRFTDYWKRQENCKKVIFGFLQEVLKHAQNSYKSDVDKHKCLIYEMLRIREEIEDFATEEEMLHHLVTFFVASEDTTSQTCSLLLVLFGQHEDIQEKVYKEINDVLGNRQLQLSDLDKFSYLDMCIKDCLRLFPIAPFVSRISSKEAQIGKILIPKDCTVICAIYSLHRNPEHWTKPNEFYPEHFLPSEESKRRSFCFVPFSAGSRGCIGKALTFMMLKTIVITLIRTYKIEADGKLQDVKLKADISLRLKDDNYAIRIKQREQM